MKRSFRSVLVSCRLYDEDMDIFASIFQAKHHHYNRELGHISLWNKYARLHLVLVESHLGNSMAHYHMDQFDVGAQSMEIVDKVNWYASDQLPDGLGPAFDFH